MVGYSAEVQSQPHLNGPKTELEYRFAWGRSALKRMGLAANSERGIWSVTEQGRVSSEQEVEELYALMQRDIAEKRRQRRQRAAEADQGLGREAELDDSETPIAERPDFESEEPPTLDDLDEVSLSWKDALLERMVRLSPEAFERLSRRVLLEAGFSNVKVIGGAGDQGIDGTAVYHMNLLSFPVYFQCKRYARSVGPDAVRDLRGTLHGREARGVLLTTGWFTRDAQLEATRDGPATIELIDGERLCDLLKQYEIGVLTKTRIIEDVHIDLGYFASFEDEKHDGKAAPYRQDPAVDPPKLQNRRR